MLRSYKLRLKPTAKQRASLEGVLALSCDLYNAALQERRDAWKIQRKTINYNHQQHELVGLRADDPEIKAVASDIEREPLRRVDRAFKAFFRRCKLGQKPGFPRFRAKSRYDSFTFSDKLRITNNVIVIPNFGGIRFRTGRTLQGKPRTATIKRNGKKWEARIVCDIGPAPEKSVVSNPIGIDLGLTNFAALSDGTVIDNPHWTRRYEDRITRANKALALKKKGSRNRKRAVFVLREAHRRAADARHNFTHHVSKWLISNFDLIAYEKLNIAGMVRGNLAKSILDAAWGELIWQLTYKAEEAGKWAVPVNPRNTTINCSGCGEKVPKTLAQRTHSCPVCGLTLDRDHNAAINILALGKSAAGVSLQNIYAPLKGYIIP
jgi:putative transposase